MTGKHGQDLDFLGCGLDEVSQPLTSFHRIKPGAEFGVLRCDTVGAAASVTGHAGPTAHGDLGCRAKADTIGTHSHSFVSIQSVADTTQDEQLDLTMDSHLL